MKILFIGRVKINNMKKIYKITQEEFDAIKDAVSNVLQLWQFEFIEASNENESSVSMSAKTFFDALSSEFIVEGKDK